jgi:hypothetical protein
MFYDITIQNFICLSVTVNELIKQNMHFVFQQCSMFVILVLQKNALLEIVHSLKISQHTTPYNPMLTGINVAST